MPQTIKLKRSSTANQAPTAAQLALGEVAINTYDGKMYIKKDTGTVGTPVESIVEITGGGSGDLVDDTTPDLGGDLWLNGKRVFGEGAIMMGGLRTFSSSPKSILCGNDTFDFGDSSALTATNSINTGYNNIITGYNNIAGKIIRLTGSGNVVASASTSVNGFDNSGTLAADETSIEFDSELDTTYMDSLVSNAGRYGDKDYIPHYLYGYNTATGNYASECVLVTNATYNSTSQVYTLTVVRGNAFGTNSFTYSKGASGNLNFRLYKAEVRETAQRNIVAGESNIVGSEDRFNVGTGYNSLLTNTNKSNNNIVAGRLNHLQGGNNWDNLVVGREHKIDRMSASLVGGTTLNRRSDAGDLESCLFVGRWDAEFGLPEVGNICQVNLGGANINYRNAPYSFTFGRGCQTGSSNNNESAAQSTAIGYASRTWLANGFCGGNNSDCFSDSGMAFGNGATASKGFSNFAFGRGVTTPVSDGAAEGASQIAVGEYNDYLIDEREYFGVGTGTGDGLSYRYTSLSIRERTSDDKADTTGFCGIVMKALAESAMYASDSAAATGGVPIGGLYRYGSNSSTANEIRIRVA